MIPYGLNPFGLEDRKITFHYLVNGVEDDLSKTEFPNRMYCWLGIPKTIRDSYGYEFTTVIPTSVENYDELKKYRSKKIEELDSGVDEPYWGTVEDDNLYMVVQDKDIYFCTWYDYSVPEYATVFVIDTSGSMNSDDYNSCKRSIALTLYDYFNFEPVEEEGGAAEPAIKDAKVFVYSGTYIKNMSDSTSILGTLNVGDISASEIYPKCNSLVNRIRKNKSSEAMISCLYNAICEIQQNVLSDPSDPIRPGRHLKGLVFVLLTDESIFTADTLNGYRKLIGTAASPNWLYWWQSGSGTKFPISNYPITSSGENVSFSTPESKKNFANQITNALIQMSYYYGVNTTWALTHDITRDFSTLKDHIPFVSKGNLVGDVVDVSDSETTQKWIIPSNYHVDEPYSFMCAIVFHCPTGVSFKPEYVMSESDQYCSTDTIKTKFHAYSEFDRNIYFAFRYVGGRGSLSEGSDYIDIPLTDKINGIPIEKKLVWQRGNSSSAISDLQSFDTSSESGIDYFVSPSYYDGIRIDYWGELRTLTYRVTFNPNGGRGQERVQEFEYGVAQPLFGNTFIYPGKVFRNWATSPDGSGDVYTDGQTITPSSSIELFAQWEDAGTTTITFRDNVVVPITVRFVNNYDYL